MSENTVSKWPKVVPPLTPEQRQISDDFMRHWHDVLPRRFGLVERFNHGYPVRHAPRSFTRTLEIGAGLGEHLKYECLSPAQRSGYVALDIRECMIERLKARFPDVRAVVADCQKAIPYPDEHFDRILAIHVLEHLPNLPLAPHELRRVCNRVHGILSVVIPCEGGIAYTLARRISAQRIFERRYRQSYQWLIRREHLKRPTEILDAIRLVFAIVHRSFFPFPVPLVTPNLCIGLTLRPRP